MGTIRIANTEVAPGKRQRLEIPVSRLPTSTWLSIPVEVVNGKRDGPRLWLSAAVHGDELNGVEIIRQVLDRVVPEELSGCLIAAPIVNVFGFVEQSRYLPDGRDLNRSFPGSEGGSLASRLACLFMQEVVQQCSYGIDLHTGSNHRTNLAQIRGDMRVAETRRCAEAFGAPVVMHAQTRDGSLRDAATKLGIHVLLYEAGEPLRFNDDDINLGTSGVLRVMAALKMRRKSPKRRSTRPPAFVEKSSWVRARRGGILRLSASLGQRVAKKQVVGTVADAFGDDHDVVRAPFAGLVIGHTNNPLVHQGDAVLHLAKESVGL